jgi:hypothetical protein
LVESIVCIFGINNDVCVNQIKHQRCRSYADVGGGKNERIQV